MNCGMTGVEQFGSRGGSNGRLLMGVMRTKYPEKFGILVCDMSAGHALLPSTVERRFLDGLPWQAGQPPRLGVHRLIFVLLEHFGDLAVSAGAVHRGGRVHTGHSRKMTATL
uniref:U1740r n=1 Tax=Mycobacterium leprae TaxID=1769 RepID=Q50077_MYCLR|nr:u1740r [Mycobacterium leprae]